MCRILNTFLSPEISPFPPFSVATQLPGHSAPDKLIGPVHTTKNPSVPFAKLSSSDDGHHHDRHCLDCRPYNHQHCINHIQDINHQCTQQTQYQIHDHDHLDNHHHHQQQHNHPHSPRQGSKGMGNNNIIMIIINKFCSSLWWGGREGGMHSLDWICASRCHSHLPHCPKLLHSNRLEFRLRIARLKLAKSKCTNKNRQRRHSPTDGFN